MEFSDQDLEDSFKLKELKLMISLLHVYLSSVVLLNPKNESVFDTKAFKLSVQIKPELATKLLENIKWDLLQSKLFSITHRIISKQ